MKKYTLLTKILTACLLVAYARSECLVSDTQEVLGSSQEASFNETSPFNGKSVIDILIDSNGNRYEIVKAAPLTIFKINSSDTVQWAKSYGVLVAFAGASSLLRSETVISLAVAQGAWGALIYLEINTSDGSINLKRKTPDSSQISSNIAAENAQVLASPEGGTMYYFSSDVLVGASEKRINKMTISETTDNVSSYSMGTVAEDLSGLTGFALSDTKVLVANLIKDTNSQYTDVSLTHLTWDATASVTWGHRVVNNLNTTYQTYRIAVTDDKARTYFAISASSKQVLVFAIRNSDGLIERKRVINGVNFSGPALKSIKTINDDKIVLSFADGNPEKSFLVIWDTNTDTGKAYSDTVGTTNFFGFGLGGGSIYFGANTGSPTYKIMKFDAANPNVVGSFIAEDTSIVFGGTWPVAYEPASYNPTLATLEKFSSVTVDITVENLIRTLDSTKKLTINVWGNPADLEIAGDSTAEYIPRVSCVDSSSTGFSNLFDYTASATTCNYASWVAMNANSAEVEYTAPDVTGNFTYLIKATLKSDPTKVYETTQKLIVTGSATAEVAPDCTAVITPSNTESAASNKGDKFFTPGVIVIFAVCAFALIATGVILGTLSVIKARRIKKAYANPEGAEVKTAQIPQASEAAMNGEDNVDNVYADNKV